MDMSTARDTKSIHQIMWQCLIESSMGLQPNLTLVTFQTFGLNNSFILFLKTLP